MQPLFIRADAGGAIGTGHVMRMIALAQGWVDRNGEWQMADGECAECRAQVVFICAKLPEALEVRLRDEGFTVVRIDAQPGSEEDLQQTLALVREQGTGDSGKEAGPHSMPHIPYPNQQWLVTDGYHFDYDYQKGVKDRSGLRLLCVDDHGYSDRWYCDAILNQNLDAEKQMKYQTDFPDTQLLLGSQFCLLRREFLRADRPENDLGPIQRLLVTLGGSDPDNATSAVLQLLHSACKRPLDLRVLLGADNPHLDAIKAFESHHRIETLQGVSNMPVQYAWADGIISAGGSTCWEWLYFGLPGAIVTIAENQVPAVEALTKFRHAALPLGWLHDFDSRAEGQVLTDWLNQPESQIDRTEANGLIDGYGSARIAGFLLGRRLMVREAQHQDCELYYYWANDPEVRKNSFSPEPIPMAKHIPWFEARLKSPDSCLLLGVDFDGNPVGQIRFEYGEERKAWIIDISTDDQSRSKGIGKQLILEGLNWMRSRFGSNLAIEADVLDSNPASLKLFQSAGLVKVRSATNFTTFSTVK